MTFPSGEAQKQLLCSMYEPVGVAPESLEYIEAHGTGTKVSPSPTPTPTPKRHPGGGLTLLVPHRWVTPRS